MTIPAEVFDLVLSEPPKLLKIALLLYSLSMQIFLSVHTRQTFLLRKMQASFALLMRGTAIPGDGGSGACA